MNKILLLFVLPFLIIATNLDAQEDLEILPPQNIYDAPIADPRWPKFSMGISHDFKNNFGDTLWVFSFGEDIGLIKFGDTKNLYEFGIQAGAFGIMDIDTSPSRLINTDYFVALEVSHAHNNFQHLWQIFHQSSHVGDEYLLSQDGLGLTRINLSYEEFKYFLRYKPSPYFSPYVTAGYIVHVDPNHIDRWVFSAGLDLYSRRISFNNSMRWIAGAYANSWQENNYSPTVTIRAGLQYERLKYCNRFLQLLIQYQFGKSQNGQFYSKKINQVGLLIAFSS